MKSNKVQSWKYPTQRESDLNNEILYCFTIIA